MQKNKLLQYENTIIRVIEIKDDKVFIVNCTDKAMPKWIQQSELNMYTDCSEEELLEKTNMNLIDLESMDSESKKFAHEHYTLIAGVLPFITDRYQRSYVISKISVDRNVSKQTIRNYLYLFLVYQNLSALAPKPKIKEKQLSKDEKNMRWALNKFYYTKNKNTLTTAYTMMLKEKYRTEDGNLMSEYPSIHQFNYFYRKYNKKQTYYISRNGIKNYQRNERPLLGDGIQEFAPSVGVGMFDATTCDIYLVDDYGNLIGRPILTACVDAYSSLCYGYYLSIEGGMYSLIGLTSNIITDKVEWCKKFGININKEDWDCNQLPATFVTDMGAEYKSENFEQITELGINIVNLPPYRPELKGAVEKFFDLIQTSYKKHLKGKGVIEPDFRERGAHDYRKDACLTLNDFEKIILHCIIYYNTKRIIDNFPYTEEMIDKNIKPYANQIWNWGLNQMGANLISVNYSTLIFTLLPRTAGKFNRYGLNVNKLRYKHDKYTERYLSGDTVMVVYNPNNVSEVWLIENNKYIPFTLIESRFKDKSLSYVQNLQAKQKDIIKAASDTNLQAQIDLAEHIETISNATTKFKNTNIKNIRKSRKYEQDRSRVDFVKGGESND